MFYIMFSTSWPFNLFIRGIVMAEINNLSAVTIDETFVFILVLILMINESIINYPRVPVPGLLVTKGYIRRLL